jgi:transcriptional regulator with GAF, ATPase, and Fis domain
MSSHAGESSLSLAERYERLKLIVDISKRLSSNLDLQSLLREIASTVRRTLDTDAVAVSVLNEKRICRFMQSTSQIAGASLVKAD